VSITVHTIKTKGKKQVPKGTEVKLVCIDPQNGKLAIHLKLPGQKKFIELDTVSVSNGIVELPVNLVFLSHAKEDVKAVSELSEKLLQDGVITWFDEKDLLPGDDWKLEIENGIDRSDYILVFLSSSSVNKEGYFQKELKIVLERRELKPEGARYIIPILIDDCEPPKAFKDIHWLKMKSEGWYDKLLQALMN
jgi:hypothetical protein